jgi:hypothetical protein
VTDWLPTILIFLPVAGALVVGREADGAERGLERIVGLPRVEQLVGRLLRLEERRLAHLFHGRVEVGGEAERLRDPTHVRNYAEEEWRGCLEAAGLEVERVELFEKRHPLEDWLARTGCEGETAGRVRRLLAHRTEDGAWFDTKILLKARKR